MTMTSSRPYILRALYEWILDNSCTPYILVNAYEQGVLVPQEHVKDGQIILNISPTAVQGLQISDDAIDFNGVANETCSNPCMTRRSATVDLPTRFLPANPIIKPILQIKTR